MTGPAQPEPANPPAAPAGDTPATPPTEDDKPLGEAGQRAYERVKAERAALSAEIERLKPLAEKAQALEEAGKSETQREREAREAAEAKYAEAEARATAAERRAIQLAVAQDLGLPVVLAERLTGSTEEEIRADAERVLNALPGGVPPAPVRRDAAAGGANPQTPDMNALLRIAAGRGA